MSIDWEKHIRSVVDLGSESYERRMTRTVIKFAAVALFVLVVWKLVWR